MIGMYMHVARPDVAPILVLPTFLLEHQSSLIGGIAMGGIILSLIGSIAGLSLGIGTMLSRDIFAKLFRVTSDAASLRLTRFVVLGVILCASAISILNEGSQILFWNYLSMALRGGGIFLPFTLAIIKPHAVSPSWAVASMVFSTAAAIIAAVMKAPIHPLFIGLAVSLVILIIGYLRTTHKQQ
jgi:SSS family solute:Na+ symporter